MVIKSSSAREVDRLIAQLRDGSPVEREAAIARLRIIGERAIDRLAAVVRSNAPAAAQASALRALEGIDDPRVREIALEQLEARTPAVAMAAVSALRATLTTDPGVLDALTALALDNARPSSVRLAALDVLSELPRTTILPVLQQVGGEDPALAARAAGGLPMATLDEPSGVTDWLKVRGDAAPLSEIHDAIVRIRERERDEPSGRRRQEWQAARGAAHQVLAARGSRVALYDLRESFAEAQTPLPSGFVAAVAMVGDAACIESLARAWEAAGREPWWRARLVEAARAIVAREKLTARNPTIKKVRARYSGFLA
jgi:hypothetical protein